MHGRLEGRDEPVGDERGSPCRDSEKRDGERQWPARGLVVGRHVGAVCDLLAPQGRRKAEREQDDQDHGGQHGEGGFVGLGG